MKDLFGRRKIYTVSDVITADNVVAEVNRALADHAKNVIEEDYLYWYRRGKQPILSRKKEIRKEICNKVVQNVASEIVAFKNGYFLTKPTFYVSRKSKSGKVNKMNDYLYLSGKAEADNSLVDWLHTVGVGVLFVESVDDEDAPVKTYSVNPMQAFVAYSRRPGNEPVMGVNIVNTGERTTANEDIYALDVFTKDTIFRLEGTIYVNGKKPVVPSNAVKIIGTEPNMLGEIPIIEYTYDRNRMGAFEAVLPLLDALNDVQSNREDGIAQFIQSLMIFYNCQLGEDENGKTITPHYIRESGAIFLKSVGQDKADLKILSEQLDQNQTQTLVNDLLKQICDIAGIPMSTNTSAGTSDNTGAVYLRSGWASADTLARNTEDLYRESDRRFTKIFLNILDKKQLISDIKAYDVDVQFTRNEMDNLLVKTQGALNLKQLGLAPEIVLAKSGVSNDPVNDIEMSKEYIDRAYGNTEPNNPNEMASNGTGDNNGRDKVDESANSGDREGVK